MLSTLEYATGNEPRPSPLDPRRGQGPQRGCARPWAGTSGTPTATVPSARQCSNPKGHGYRSDKGSLESAARSEIEEKSDVERGTTFLSKSRHWKNTAFVFEVKEDDLHDHNKQPIHHETHTRTASKFLLRMCFRDDLHSQATKRTETPIQHSARHLRPDFPSMCRRETIISIRTGRRGCDFPTMVILPATSSMLTMHLCRPLDYGASTVLCNF